MIGNGRTSRADGSGGFAFGLFGDSTEDIVSKLVTSHSALASLFDGYAVVRGNRTASVCPLPDNLALHLDSSSESRLTTGSFNSFLDVLSLVHGATIALLSLTSNSFANRKECQF